MCDWVKSTAELLRPLYDLQRELVLQSSVMWTDDTPITVLGGPKGSFQGHFWTYIGDREHPYSVYDFTTSHSRDGPARFLQSYSGYLHADAYTGYDGIFLDPGSGILEVACWSHARRRFFDAVRSCPREAHQVLEWIRQLYDIEDRAHDWSVEARRELRLAEANPVLDKIEGYWAELVRTALPKRSLGKAVTYARNQWEALRRYREDGRLTIDNTIASYCASFGRYRFNCRFVVLVTVVWDVGTGFLGRDIRRASAFGRSERPAAVRNASTCEPCFR